MINNKYISLAVLASLMLAAPAFADTTTITTPVTFHVGMGRGGMMRMRPGVVGTVASVNGTTITVTSKKMAWGKDEKTPTTTAVTYTVDASKATVTKADVASTVSAISVGDMVMVQGTVTGTNVVATTIRDGIPTKVQKPMPTPLIQGNGQPVIAGTISIVNGSILTVTNNSNVTYTVDASNAKFESRGALSTISAVAVGDNVVIQGAVNGTSVTAYSVTNQGAKATPGQPNGELGGHGNIFSGIGQFFKHLFGF